MPSGRDWRCLKLKKETSNDGFNRNQNRLFQDAQPLRYNVRNREGGDNYWIRIGSVWAHADGNGFNLQLETVPLDGRVALRIATEKNK